MLPLPWICLLSPFAQNEASPHNSRPGSRWGQETLLVKCVVRFHYYKKMRVFSMLDQETTFSQKPMLFEITASQILWLWLLEALTQMCMRFIFNCCCFLSLRHVQLFWNPMACSPPGSSVHGISQARILECIAISFSWGSSQPRNGTCISCMADRFFFPEPNTSFQLSINLNLITTSDLFIPFLFLQQYLFLFHPSNLHPDHILRPASYHSPSFSNLSFYDS